MKQICGIGRFGAVAAIFGAILGTFLPDGTIAQPYPAPPEQMSQYEANVPKTIIELQPYRREQTSTLLSGGEVKLLSLNPNINASFLLTLGDGAFHIENADHVGQQISLADYPLAGIVITGPQDTTRCELWSGEPSEFQTALDSGLPFAPLCDGKLYLRNAIAGSRSSIERVTDFLRDHVWQGEQIVRVVRDTFMKDQYAETSELVAVDGRGGATAGPRARPRSSQNMPSRLSRRSALASRWTAPDRIGWSRVCGIPRQACKAFSPARFQPRTIGSEVLTAPGNANRLDSIEGKSVDYFVAFDLARYGVGFALGTDHPRLDWSPRPRAPARIRGLPGPDGIGNASPLVRSGMVSPEVVGRTFATFTAGFKRQHGAFKFGDYADDRHRQALRLHRTGRDLQQAASRACRRSMC